MVETPGEIVLSSSVFGASNARLVSRFGRGVTGDELLPTQNPPNFFFRDLLCFLTSLVPDEYAYVPCLFDQISVYMCVLR